MRDTDYHRERAEYAKKLYDNPGMLPHRYVLVLTNRCNLRCPFCFQHKDKIEGSLNPEDWLRVVDQLPDYAWITLTGGEPFLYEGFEEIFKRVTENHRCNIISNGLLLSDPIIELLLSSPKFRVLSISVDDIGNRVRGVSAGKWASAEKMIRNFAARASVERPEVVFDIKTMILDENAENLFDIHRYCIEVLGCTTHAFQLLKGSPIQYSDRTYPWESIHETYLASVYQNFETIKNQLEQVRLYDLAAGYSCYLHPKVCDLNGDIPIAQTDIDCLNIGQYEAALYRECKFPWESLHINFDGNVFPCMAVSLGNIKEKSLVEIVQGDVFKKFKEELRCYGTLPACSRCGNLIGRNF